MAGKLNLFQWFIIQLVSTRRTAYESPGQNQAPIQKKMPYKGLLWLISFLVYFLLRMIQVGNMALPVSYQSFSSLDIVKVVTMRTRPKAQDSCSLCCLSPPARDSLMEVAFSHKNYLLPSQDYLETPHTSLVFIKGTMYLPASIIGNEKGNKGSPVHPQLDSSSFPYFYTCPGFGVVNILW